MSKTVDIALVFPPLWYFAAVPTDLSAVAGALHQRGLRVGAWDLSAGFTHHMLGSHRAFVALRREQTYLDPGAQRQASSELFAAAAEAGERFGAQWRLRALTLSGADPTHLPSALRAGLDPARNPALRYLVQSAAEVLGSGPDVVAIALVHPDQVIHCAALARILRTQGFAGRLLLYGSLEDVLSPEDFAPDLLGEPPHLLFRDFDAAVIGDAEPALIAVAEAGSGPIAPGLPNVLLPGEERVPERTARSLDALPLPRFDWVRPEHYPFPRPVVDLRLGRGCPWGRCAFCAIQAHQVGYRAQPAQRVIRAMDAAHGQLGATHFRVRDDLLTPSQLRELGTLSRTLDFDARWTARSRFEPNLSRGVLATAAAGGLEELWLGLESASPRVRALMDKGVRQEHIGRILREGSALGLRIRALCMLGFPGETEAEARRTVDFVLAHQEHLAGVSLTPFELMRRSPMASDPASHGVAVAPIPGQRFERITCAIPVVASAGMDDEQRRRLFRESLIRLEPMLTAGAPGPGPTHAWLSASLRAQAR